MLRRVHPADHLLLLAPEHELVPGQVARVAAHVATCAACRTRRARLLCALGADSAHDGNEADGHMAAHAEVRQRLQTALRHERRLRASGWRGYAARVRQVAGAPLALAATVLLAAFALQLPAPLSIAAGPVEAEREARPIPVFTPGAVSALSASALCAGERPSRLVSADARDQVLVEYGMQAASDDTYELDALITPELGGTTAAANLWPQRYDAVWNARVKDGLESLLAARVCAGTMPLRDAQNALALDWVDAYKRVFDTRVPLPSHLASTDVDDELTLLEPARRPGSTRGGTMSRLLFVVRFGEPAPPPRRQPGRLDVRVTATSADEPALRRS